jgi:hypothetical protein
MSGALSQRTKDSNVITSLSFRQITRTPLLDPRRLASDIQRVCLAASRGENTHDASFDRLTNDEAAN